MLIDIAQPEELFHTAIGTAFVDITVEGHRETWPIRSKRFRSFLRRCRYQATGEAASAAEIRSALDLLEARRSSTARSGPSISVPPSTTDASTSTSPMSTGAWLILGLTDGR